MLPRFAVVYEDASTHNWFHCYAAIIRQPKVLEAGSQDALEILGFHRSDYFHAHKVQAVSIALELDEVFAILFQNGMGFQAFVNIIEQVQAPDRIPDS